MSITPTHAFSANLLDSRRLSSNSTVTFYAILRKYKFSVTSDGRPFVRVLFEDIHGFLITGRLFNLVDYDMTGKMLASLDGSLVNAAAEVSYFAGGISLVVSEISPVPQETSARFSSCFTGKYESASKDYAQTVDILKRLFETSGYDKLCDFFSKNNMLPSMIGYRDTEIYNGLPGYLMCLIHNTLRAVEGICSAESIVAFIAAVCTYYATSQTADCHSDEGRHLFIASMTDKRMSIYKEQPVLANKLSELTSLFTQTGKVISSDTFLLYSIFDAFRSASQMQAASTYLPDNGTIPFSKYTLRK